MATEALPTPVFYDAGFIILSYFVSLAGSWTTLELLHRRTSSRGIYNWFLLIGSCMAMGGVAIWCMHFIGNRAIVLDGGIPNRQIAYNASFTALSFFLPIIVLLGAFYLLGVTDKADEAYLLFGAMMTGAAVCGMHYVGQLGISNYSCYYKTRWVVTSALIAVIASLIALTIFFRMQERWTNNWWKRMLCAAMLAGAVSGMHWSASRGTEYYFKMESLNSGGRTQTAIVAAVLSVSACAILLISAVVASRRQKTINNRAQELVLACAYFDNEGRIMLTQEGAFPCEKITNRFVERTFGEDELSRSHTTFAWVYEASRNWSLVKEYITGMKERLDNDPASRRYRPGNGSPAIDDSVSDESTNFSPIFKRLFCVAAQGLASHVHEPLEDLGTLFEEPLETGMYLTKKPGGPVGSGVRRFLRRSRTMDIESGQKMPDPFGRGKYLFVTRRLSKADVTKFASLGFRFGTIPQISEVLSKNVQVSQSEIARRLERMQLSTSEEYLPPPGVYVACFMVRPSIKESFDVLVTSKKQNQLPMTSLLADKLNEWQIDVLRDLDEMTVREVLQILKRRSSEFELEDQFCWHLHSAVAQVVDQVGDYKTMMDAKISTKPISIPCRPADGSSGPTTCTILPIRVMAMIQYRNLQPDLAFVPLSFFSAQQTLESSLDNEQAFARRLKMEFGEYTQSADILNKTIGSKHNDSAPRRPNMGGIRVQSDVDVQYLELPEPSSVFKLSKARPHRRSDESHIVAREKDWSEDEQDDMQPSFGTPNHYSAEIEAGKAPDVVESMVTERKATFVNDLMALFRV